MIRRSPARLSSLAAALAILSGCVTTHRAQMQADAPPAPALRGALAYEAYVGPYWHDRFTYPTGQYQQRWALDAGRDAARVPAAMPDGASARRSANGLDAINFTLLGPQPLLPTGDAGRTNVIVSHPGNPAVAWLASDGGGIWKTSNCCSANTTWQIKTDLPEIASSAISDLTLDPSNPDLLYAGTGDLRYGSFSFGASGVLKSADGGETWTVLGADVFTPFYPPSANGFPQYQAIGQVEVDPNDSNKVVAGTKTGLYLSYDAGASWTGPCLTNAFTTQRQDITAIVLRDLGATTQIVAGVGTRGFNTVVQPDLNQNGANGIYRTNLPASGCPAAWTLISRPDNGWPAGTGGGTPGSNTLGRIELAQAPSDVNTLYAKVASGSDAAAILGVWRSTDGGDTWTQRASNSNFTGCSNATSQSWYNIGISVHPSYANIVFSSLVDAFRSSDGGATWSNITCGYGGGNVHVDHHARSFVANPGNPAQPNVLLGSDGGAWYSSNPYFSGSRPSFISLNNTLPTVEFYTGDITANFATAQNRGAVGGAQDNGCSVAFWNNGAPVGPTAWTRRNGGDGMYVRIEPVIGNCWYMSSQNGALVVFSNLPGGGGSTNASPSAAGYSSDTKSFVTPFEIYRNGTDASPSCGGTAGNTRLILGTNRVWETIQGAIPRSSWYSNSPVLTRPSSPLADRAFINQLAYAVNTPANAIAGTNDGKVWMGFNLGAGTTNSANWVDVTGGNGTLPNRPILDVATDPLDPLIGYAAVGGFDQNTPATPGHVYRVECTAACASFTWRDVSGNLPNIPANSIIVNPHRPNQVFVGTDWGLYFTDDVSAPSPVWQLHAGLPRVMIWDMTIDRGFTTLAVWTRSRGGWVWPLPTADDLFANGFE